ncbi:hypothetical protein OVY01_19335 [Robbsia sp. Bb-Pol-6]|uniref:RNase H type-1 domain-containing protein n=1 Tax=Robbsia betulipollinis TaxID=2981849 RepID=A0ABT3ZRX3_9BURK|nr:hypothetical protein [Robbsia betulipollinis]MCY0389303.1 hypothetical protein [Robbsia betulipollinis]
MPTINPASSALRSRGESFDSNEHVQKNTEKGKERARSPGATGILSGLPMRRRGSTASEPDYTSHRRDSSPDSQEVVSGNERLLTMNEFEKTMERFGEFHIGEMSSLAGRVHKLQDEVGSLSKTLVHAQDQRDQRTEAAKLRAKNRAVSREQTISDLKSENDALIAESSDTRRAVDHLQDKIASMENQLGFLNTEFERKTKVVSSQSKLIRSTKSTIKDIKSGQDEMLREKDLEIFSLRQDLDAVRSELAETREENHVLQRKIDVVATTGSGITPGKTAALVKSGEKINDRLDVLQSLNKKLLEERRVLIAENSANLAELQKLKRALEAFMTKVGGDPSKLPGRS